MHFMYLGKGGRKPANILANILTNKSDQHVGPNCFDSLLSAILKWSETYHTCSYRKNIQNGKWTFDFDFRILEHIWI